MALIDSRHAKVRFFKYTTAATALKILESFSVRYSSPLLFNDPFDIQAGLHFDFDINSLPDKLLNRIAHIVTQAVRPNLSQADPLGKAIHLIWQEKVSHGFPKDEIWKLIRPIFVQLTDQAILLQSQYQQAWWSDFLPRLRVFSVTEEKDNLLMWSHYAHDHSGVVFEFLVLPKEDNPLCVAQPVLYHDAPPSFFTEEQWLDEILGVHKFDVDAHYYQYAYIKNDIWAYEKEWRVWDLKPEPTETLFSDYPLRPNEIGAVYLGCRIPNDAKEKILSLLSIKSPGTKTFQARKSTDAYRLDFDAI